MDTKFLHKRIMIISVVVIVFATGSLMAGIFFTDLGSDFLFPSYFVTIIFPVLAILTSFIVTQSLNHSALATVKYLTYSFPVIVSCIVFLMSHVDILLIQILGSAILLILSMIVVIHFFILTDPGSNRSFYLFIGTFIIALLMKRLHLMYAGALFVIICGLFGFGMYMYGIRSIFLSFNNRYLKYVSFFGCLLITVSLMGMLWKVQHWPMGTFLVNVSRVSLVAITVVVLLTITSSGYLEWEKLHRRMLKRLILPWIFVFTLFIIKFLLPDLDTCIWRKDFRVIKGKFGMTDYQIEVKNNVEQK